METKSTINHSTVTLIDSMGDDLRVVNAARVSFSKESLRFSDNDAGLLRYLARKKHWTPFGHVMITLRIFTPVFVARQYFKHIVGANKNDAVVNETSRRYVDATPVMYLPDTIRKRPDKSVKQGSDGEHPRSEHWRDQMSWLFDHALDQYDMMIADGVAPEQARIVLPIAHMTEFYETGSLAYYARVMKLRLDSHAQAEIRDLAQLIADVIADVAPVSWAALLAN